MPEFLMDAVLNYDGTDSPARRASARALLAQHPELSSRSIWAAAAAGDHRALLGFLSADPSSARSRGGPKNWEPLLYLTYSRPGAQVTADDLDRCLHSLLDAGADPNAGYLPAGCRTPFTALTGLFGGGEQDSGHQDGRDQDGRDSDGGDQDGRDSDGGDRDGDQDSSDQENSDQENIDQDGRDSDGGDQDGHQDSSDQENIDQDGGDRDGDQDSGDSDPDRDDLSGVAQPAHPHSNLLVGRLLEAGADPNDAQTLYNRMFEASDDHLELLFSRGLGTGDGGPWRRRDLAGTDTPEQMLRGQLAWAVIHGYTRRIALLARHGVDLRAPLDRGHLPVRTPLTPLQLAVVAGRRQSAATLRELGVDEKLDPATELIGALLDADAEGAAQIGADHPGLLAAVRRAHPSLILRAAVIDRPDAIELLVGRGFDANALGRADIVKEEPWETALHHAAAAGALDVVRVLLRCGADRLVTDRRFGATPLDWARYFDQAAAICLLA